MLLTSLCAMEALLALYKKQDQELRKRKADVDKQLRAARKRSRVSEPSPRAASASAPSSDRALQTPNLSSAKPKAAALRMWLMVLMMATQRMEVAVAFAMGQGRPLRFQFQGAEDDREPFRSSARTHIRQAFDKLTDAELLDMWSDHRHYGTERRILLVVRHVMEYDLFHWLVKQHCEQAVAPDAALMLSAAVKFLPDDAPDWARARWKNMLENADKSAFKWLSSFRRRWHAKPGKVIPLEPPIPMEAAREKVSCLS